MAFFKSKTDLMINFFAKISNCLKKTANIFAQILGENIFKISTFVPEAFV
jgi:uncharacterized protein Yka (UPF0111/DUF47 family)